MRIPGELCRALGTDRVLDLAEAMAGAGDLKVSRLDLALDDQLLRIFQGRLEQRLQESREKGLGGSSEDHANDSDRKDAPVGPYVAQEAEVDFATALWARGCFTHGHKPLEKSGDYATLALST